MFGKVVFWGLVALAFLMEVATVVVWVVAAWTFDNPEVQGALTTTGVITLVVGVFAALGAVIMGANKKYW